MLNAGRQQDDCCGDGDGEQEPEASRTVVDASGGSEHRPSHCICRFPAVSTQVDRSVGRSLSSRTRLSRGFPNGGTWHRCRRNQDRLPARRRATGVSVASARGPGANLQALGELEVEKVLHEVMEQALAIASDAPAAICLGIAGVDRDDDAAVIRGIMRRIGHKAPVLVVNDALIALEAGAGDRPGHRDHRRHRIDRATAATSAGKRRAPAAGATSWPTRAAAIGSAGRRCGGDAAGRRPRAGHGAHAARARALRGRRAAASSCTRSTTATSGGKLIAALGPRSQAAADEGDAVAPRDRQRRGGESWSLAAQSVAERLEMRGDAFPFVLAGGIFRVVPSLPADVTTRVAEVAPRASASAARREPALGAVRLALAEARGGARIPTTCERKGIATRESRHSEERGRRRARRCARVAASARATRPVGGARPADRAHADRSATRELRRRHRLGRDRFLARHHLQPRRVRRACRATHPASYRAFMEEHLFRHVNLPPRRIHFLNGTARIADAECARYERAIAAGRRHRPADPGHRRNGHIGFNEPAPALRPTRIARASTPATRRANARCSADAAAACRAKRCRWAWGRSCQRAADRAAGDRRVARRDACARMVRRHRSRRGCRRRSCSCTGTSSWCSIGRGGRTALRDQDGGFCSSLSAAARRPRRSRRARVVRPWRRRASAFG